jgi:hypothetical protein
MSREIDDLQTEAQNEDEQRELDGPIYLVPEGSEIDTKIDLEIVPDAPLFEKVALAESATGPVIIKLSTMELIFMATAISHVSKPMFLLLGAPDGEYNQNWYMYRTQFEGSLYHDDLAEQFEGAQPEAPIVTTPKRQSAKVRRHSIQASDQIKAQDERAENISQPEFDSTADIEED